jgi:hypothetical protein
VYLLFALDWLGEAAWASEPAEITAASPKDKDKRRPATPVKKRPKPTPPSAKPAPPRPATPHPPPTRTPPDRASPGRPITPDPARRPATPAAIGGSARDTVPAVRHPEAPPRTTRPATPLVVSTDHRYARPDPFATVPRPAHPAPRYVWYRPYWTHWWVHPYWRWTHATTVVVAFDFTPDPWDAPWVPPPRAHWVWIPGYLHGAFWVPGHWEPAFGAAVWYGVGWTWVPGWWMGTIYVDGYWRRADRAGWRWIDGYYLEDGEYVRGWWEPVGPPPRAGMVWEAGYWDGRDWVEGFWRPEQRAGYRWVCAWLDADGVYHAGYWEPTEDRPGQVWIPGWFDGERWIEGYWVPQSEYDAADPEHWQPDPGWDAREAPADGAEGDEVPPALPVEGPED